MIFCPAGWRSGYKIAKRTNQSVESVGYADFFIVGVHFDISCHIALWPGVVDVMGVQQGRSPSNIELGN